MRGDMLLLSMCGAEPGDHGRVQGTSWAVQENTEEEKGVEEEEERAVAAGERKWVHHAQS